MVKVRARNGQQVIEIEDPEFIAYFNKLKPKTKTTYETMFRRLLEFDSKITAKNMRTKKKEWERGKLVEFHQWVLNHGYSENYAKSACGMIRGFFTSWRIPFMFTQQEKKTLNEASRKTEDFLFSREDLKKMWDIADLGEKWVLCNKSLGMRIEEFARICFGDLRSIHLEEEAPVYFGDFQTGKAHVTAHPFLDSDCVPIVKQLIELNRDKANSDKVFPKSNERASYVVQQLVLKAHIETGGKTVRFHNLRKFCNDRLKSHMASEKADMIIGHSIGKTQKAYIYEEVKECFSRAMSDLVLNGNGAIKQVKAEVQAQGQTIEQLVKLLAERDKTIAEMKNQQNTMNKSISDFQKFQDIIEKKLNIKQRVPID